MCLTCTDDWWCSFSLIRGLIRTCHLLFSRSSYTARDANVIILELDFHRECKWHCRTYLLTWQINNFKVHLKGLESLGLYLFLRQNFNKLCWNCYHKAAVTHCLMSCTTTEISQADACLQSYALTLAINILLFILHFRETNISVVWNASRDAL